MLSFIHLMLDPLIWSVMYVWVNASTSIELDEVETARLWMLNNFMAAGKVAFMIVGHAKLYLEYILDHRKRAAVFVAMGTVDPALVQILGEHGIHFTKEGTLTDPAAYQKLIKGE